MGLIAAVTSFLFPKCGLKPLVELLGLLGLAVVLGIVYGPGQLPGASRPALWLLLGSGGVFLYLWRLSALLFDLVFVWHRYICLNHAEDFLRRCNKGCNETRVGQLAHGTQG